MPPIFLGPTNPSTALDLVDKASFAVWIAGLSESHKALVAAIGFKGETGQIVIFPNAEGVIDRVAAGVGDSTNPYIVAVLPNTLPPGNYRIERHPESFTPDIIALAWSDGAYSFTKYKASKASPCKLLWPSGSDSDQTGMIAEAIDNLRDMVNTPACDLGPSRIAAKIRKLGEQHNARVTVTEGVALEKDYPLIHAVGRAAKDAPRYVELTWGREDAPRIALVGKGVTFDTGGLHLKTGDTMNIMKKDMGGAAHVIALASLIMEFKLDVRLILSVPVVENAIGSDAFRPGDILMSRKGLTVEIGNTDAEGRLILADALARASEQEPELMIDFATLTGAARVALGPDLAPLYTDDDQLADEVLSASRLLSDPVWRLPLYANYASGLDSPIADLRNISDGPMAGSITAALFLKKFVNVPVWAHLDVWSWRPARYGRPAGAAANGLRAIWATLKARYG